MLPTLDTHTHPIGKVKCSETTYQRKETTPLSAYGQRKIPRRSSPTLLKLLFLRRQDESPESAHFPPTECGWIRRYHDTNEAGGTTDNTPGHPRDPATPKPTIMR
ncbi:hypothetical protein J3459_015393 [Metarhizium acridum]|nr:hypothetical protein J3459_015393 [Metarhizium acridum]